MSAAANIILLLRDLLFHIFIHSCMVYLSSIALVPLPSGSLNPCGSLLVSPLCQTYHQALGAQRWVRWSCFNKPHCLY